MKKSLMFWVVVLTIVVLSTSFTACTSASTDASTSEPTAYYTEQLAPGIIRVIAMTYTGDSNNRGYGPALARAITDIAKKYEIIGITPINNYFGLGSATKELIIIVKPKQ